MCCPDVLHPDPDNFQNEQTVMVRDSTFLGDVSAVDPEIDDLKKNLTLWPDVCVNRMFFFLQSIIHCVKQCDGMKNFYRKFGRLY